MLTKSVLVVAKERKRGVTLVNAPFDVAEGMQLKYRYALIFVLVPLC